MSDEFGDRMKRYEQEEAGRRLMPLLPVVIRLDGKNFSGLTRKLQRTKEAPFSEGFHRTMVGTALVLAKETGARTAYTQSDEITLVLKSDSYESQIYFDGKIQKLVSILAARAAVAFNYLRVGNVGLDVSGTDQPVFDCRVWNVPNETEAANAVLWREQDAAKNSISMAARTMFSHKELMGKSGKIMQEMMFQKGINWNNYPDFFKRGTFILRRPVVRNGADRMEYLEIPMPKFSSVSNREDVIFRGANPTMLEASNASS